MLLILLFLHGRNFYCTFFLELYLCMWMQCRKNCTHKYIRRRHMKIHTFFLGYSERERKKKIVVDNFFYFLFSAPLSLALALLTYSLVLPILFWHILNIRALYTLHFTKCEVELWCIEVN